MKRALPISALAGLLAIGAAAGPAPPYDPAEALPGGAATAIVDDPAAAFARPAGNLPEAERARFIRGAELFYRRWIAGPAPPPALTGLGPLYNALSCQQCHLNDGRGRPPAPGDAGAASTTLRFVPAHSAYGEQLQQSAVAGRQPEGRIETTWANRHARIGDGDVVELRRPVWRVAAPAYGAAASDPLDPTKGVAWSGRIALPLAGAGLLEAVPSEEIAARGDFAGRFGWTGEIATVRAQALAALLLDMGVSTAETPYPGGDCTAAQSSCGAITAAAEAPADVVDNLVFYAANLGPPPRPDAAEPQVLRGREVFHEAGCASCHRPSFTTGESRWPWLSGQKIWPYTDLRRHDMGPGLADGSQTDWRTAPLWGLGRNAAVNGNTFFLHDGRARSPLEAILWHGGEAAAARDAVAALPRPRREDLLAFLRSL